MMDIFKVKDFKKYEKDIIKAISELIAYKSAYLHHDNFSYEFREYEAYKFQDKALAKRIKKYLMNKFGIKAECWEEREFYLSCSEEEPICLIIRVRLTNMGYESVTRF